MHWYSNETVTLSSQEPFAVGGNRYCFRYPGKTELCIKVNQPGRAEDVRKRSPLYKKIRRVASFDDNVQEYRAYQQRAIRNADEVVWSHLSRCHGWINTDIGIGLVSDFFADNNNEPAMTLEVYLKQFGLTKEIENCIQQFSEYLRSTLLLTKNLLPHNIVVEFEDDKPNRLVIIDGLGIVGFFAFAKLSKSIARGYVEKRIKKMLLRVSWEAGGRKQLWKDVEKRGSV